MVYFCVMPKARLEFDLNDPDDAAAHHKAVHAKDVYSLLFEYDSWLREIIKYHDRKDWPSLEKARGKLLELMNEHGVEFD